MKTKPSYGPRRSVKGRPPHQPPYRPPYQPRRLVLPTYAVGKVVGKVVGWHSRLATLALAFALVLAAAPAAPNAHADPDGALKLKIAIINPAMKEQDMPVKYHLPKGIQPEHILDRGEMGMGYDFDAGVYYVYQTLTMKSLERRVLEVVIQDIWIIPKKELTAIKNYTAALMQELEGSGYLETGEELALDISSLLAKIARAEEEASLNARHKINTYYENIGRMKRIRENVLIITALLKNEGLSVEKGVQVPESVSRPMFEDKGIGEWEAVDLEVKITNAAMTHLLPESITPALVKDAAGLDMRYDFDKKKFYVFKSDIKLEPGEEKTFVIRLKDMWRVPEDEIEALRLRTRELEFSSRKAGRAKEARAMFEATFLALDEIQKSQNQKVPLSDHIASYKNNLKTMKEIRKSLTKPSYQPRRLVLPTYAVGKMVWLAAAAGIIILFIITFLAIVIWRKKHS